jgi:hypothetical protein
MKNSRSKRWARHVAHTCKLREAHLKLWWVSQKEVDFQENLAADGNILLKWERVV